MLSMLSKSRETHFYSVSALFLLNKLERKSGCRKMSCRMTVYCDPKEAFFMHFFMHFIVTNGSIWIDKWKNRECHFEKQMFTKFNQEDNSTKSAPFMFNNVIFRALIRFFYWKRSCTIGRVGIFLWFFKCNI